MARKQRATSKAVADRLCLKLDHPYICAACAHERGGRWPDGHCATFHSATCPYCGVAKSLASIGDWNWADKVRRGMRD